MDTLVNTEKHTAALVKNYVNCTMPLDMDSGGWEQIHNTADNTYSQADPEF